MPNEDLVAGKIDAEIRRINSTIAARKTDINILKRHLKGHPPPAIEDDIRRRIENLNEIINSITKDRTQWRKQRDKLKSKKLERFAQAGEANNTPMRLGIN